MTRKDYSRYAKIFGLSLLMSVPIILVLDLLIQNYVSQFAIITIDVVIVITLYVFTLWLAEKRTQRIAKKRQQFLEEKQKQQDEQTETQTTLQTASKKKKKKHKKKKH